MPLSLPFLLPLTFSLSLALSPNLTTLSHLTDVVPADSMPPPWLDTLSICHPSHSSSHHATTTSICDPSGLLSRRESDKLDTRLAQIFEGRRPYSLISCPSSPSAPPSGFRVALALVRRMPFDARTLSDRAETFARTLFDQWHLSDNCASSVLLFLSLEDRRMFIKTGALAANYLSESNIDDVYSHMIPYLNKGRVYKALRVALDRIASYLSKYNGEHSGQNDSRSAPSGLSLPLFFRPGPAWWDLELSIVAIIFALFVVLACINGVGGLEASRLKRERRHVLRKLNIVRSEYNAALLPQYIPSTCPFCHDDLAPPWAPTVPTLPTENAALAHEDQVPPSRPVRKLRCGHAFHESCFDDEHPTPSGTIPDCPVCGDRAGGISTPPSTLSTRGQDAAFRVQKLADEYSHILTPEVVTKLNSETPDLWPEQMTESYWRPVSRRRSCRSRARGESRDGGRDGGWFGNWGGLLAAGGLGALLASMFSGWGRGRDEQSFYSDIPGGDGGGNVAQWIGGSAAQGGGGHGAGWGGVSSNVTPQFMGGDGGGGHGAGWGSAFGNAASRLTGGDGGGGHGASWGDTLSDAASRFTGGSDSGGGGGWGGWSGGGGGGGNGGGDGGGGHGSGW